MKNLLSPLGLIISHVLPQLLLIAILFGHYEIVESLLEEESKVLWRNFGMVEALLLACTIGLSITFWYKKMKLHLWTGAALMLIHIGLAYVFFYHLDQLSPWGIPRWMRFEDMPLYVIALSAPALIHNLFILIIRLTPEEKNHKVWVNFVIAVCVPLFWYLFINVLSPMMNRYNSDEFGIHAVVILFISLTLVFLFFIGRGIYVLTIKNSPFWKKYALAWKIPIAIVFPLAGLALNNGELIGGPGDAYIFGDFSNPWFYILAFVNGVLICLPDNENKPYRLFLLASRSMTFGFTTYFFFVFLPWLPLSVLAVIAFGLGFLMLSPLVLMVVHTRQLSEDIRYLKQHFSANVVRAMVAAGVIVLPVAITLTYVEDRKTIHAALDYVYNPDLSDTEAASLKPKRVERALQHAQLHMERNRSGISSSKLPYLSMYYRWIVFDNLRLQGENSRMLKSVFLDDHYYGFDERRIGEQVVFIDTIVSETEWNETEQYYETWLHFELTEYGQRNGQSEYTTTFELPEGVWISDHYLYNGEERLQGLLAERKTAQWIYGQIVRSQRDPGLLHYENGNRIRFSVFPFEARQTRNTGIRFVHQSPTALQFDDKTIFLGDTTGYAPKSRETHGVHYIVDEGQLPLVQRTPYYHLALDVSKNAPEAERMVAAVEEWMQHNSISAEQCKISLVNSAIKTYNGTEDWKSALQTKEHQGGFFLGRLMEQTFFQEVRKPDLLFPRFVAFTNNVYSPIFSEKLGNWSFVVPEEQYFWIEPVDTEDPSLVLSWSGDTVPQQQPLVADLSNIPQVKAYPNERTPEHFFLQEETQSIHLKSPVWAKDFKKTELSAFDAGLLQEGIRRSHLLYPEESNDDWTNLVRHSFKTGIMTELTSYISLENEAQRKALEQKQEEVLNGHQSLKQASNGNFVGMDEPPLWWFLIGGLLLLFFKQRKQLRNGFKKH